MYIRTHPNALWSMICQTARVVYVKTKSYWHMSTTNDERVQVLFKYKSFPRQHHTQRACTLSNSGLTPAGGDSPCPGLWSLANTTGIPLQLVTTVAPVASHCAHAWPLDVHTAVVGLSRLPAVNFWKPLQTACQDLYIHSLFVLMIVIEHPYYLFFKRIYVPPTYDSHFCAAINVTTSITVTIMSQLSDPNIQVL